MLPADPNPVPPHIPSQVAMVRASLTHTPLIADTPVERDPHWLGELLNVEDTTTNGW